MTTVKPVIRWFKDIGEGDPAARRQKRPWATMIREAGGKAANLAEMVQSDIPVPPGFVVLSDTYFDFVRAGGLGPVIEEALRAVDVHRSGSLNAASASVKGAILGAEMPAGIASEIKAAYRGLGGGYVAVRSSATAEDLPDASFAGQQSTFLNVIGEENVVQAVKGCWASLFEPRAIFYRAENDFDHLSVGIAVPVQRMVNSEVSGVMFTVEPSTNDTSKILIEAIYGLGEGIVSGQITPDEYVVNKSSMTIDGDRSTVGVRQDWQLIRDGDIDGGAEGSNQKAIVDLDKREAPKLHQQEVLAVARLGEKLEKHYGHPQDIEWAMEGGRLHILQTRPVTTLMRMERGAKLEGVNAPVIAEGACASPGVASGHAVVIHGPGEIDKVREGDILVTEMTTPDFVPAMKRAAAIITDKGGRTCHAAIVSREIGVPCVVGTGNGSSLLSTGQMISVDATSGKVYEGHVKLEPAEAAVKSRYGATRTKVYVNLADPDLAERVASMNVDGVGLLRAEFVAAHIGEHPRHMLDQGRGEEFTEKLAEGIMKFAGAFHPRPVVYRCTDFKTNEYRNLTGGERYEEEEENPMIGFRGCSRYLSEPSVFHLETEAIKRVHERYDNLNVMIPFVRTPQEMAEVKALLEKEGVAKGKLWMMVEVPSTVILLDKFIDVGLDGISIGSNDLTQLVLGVDRDNAKYADVFDERNEAVMWCLERVIRTARERGVTVSICGQAPSFYPDLTAELVDWGITSVSVSPDVIVQTRNIIGDVESKRGILPPQG